MKTVTTPCENCLFLALEKKKVEEFSMKQAEIASLQAANASLTTELRIIKDSYFYDSRYLHFTTTVILITILVMIVVITPTQEETISYLKKELKELRLAKTNS